MYLEFPSKIILIIFLNLNSLPELTITVMYFLLRNLIVNIKLTRSILSVMGRKLLMIQNMSLNLPQFIDHLAELIPSKHK